LTNFRKFVTLLTIIGVVTFSWWLVLLFNIFPKKYYISDNYKLGESSAIIVLTGGKGRIEKGIELLDKGFGRFLFISGVFKESEIKTKYSQIEKRDCCIIYDQNAKNTFENALEVRGWLKQKDNLTNLIIVSSYYHLPRSYIIFKNVIYDKNIKLTPADSNIRFDEKIIFHIKLIVSEYFKIIYTILSLL